MSKIVSLEEKTIDVHISGEVFTISRLTLKARDMIATYKRNAAVFLTSGHAYVESIQSLKTVKEVQKAQELYMDEAEKKAKEVVELRYQCIKKVLSDNGYKYVADLWENIDEAIPDQFLTAVFEKNNTAEKKSD